ncbi:hypothetical protein PpBr36_03313 [Pyricularia pennisetigena]|uniref:hypothetical protein n=1 Tax=Pyricularia pennisetigena TaxID=1578925 RepID=UPI00114D89F3|nr:hypothetical protein PpBr36_03313 [Pyricularia pennisetigena]TLS29952.1 hypothetical protein PpBr36_03313 [Pyricularia pennisetigena]
MPKNKGKGGKNRRRGKNENDNLKREMPRVTMVDSENEPWNEYATIVSAKGGGSFKGICYIHKQHMADFNVPTSTAPDKEGFYVTERHLQIRGKLRKKQWVQAGDLVLMQVWPNERHKGSIVERYPSDEARKIKEEHELPSYVRINETDVGGENRDDDDGFEFAEVAGEDSEEDSSDDGKGPIDIDDI